MTRTCLNPGLDEVKPDEGLYFTGASRDVSFISTGCTLLDCAMGGGYAIGRVCNIVGDKSTGKTLLAIEACANYERIRPEGKIRYVEAEAAFDLDYAEQLGMPDKVDLVRNVFTVEDMYDNLIQFIDEVGDKGGLYILDSLDALSDAAELERAITDGSYGANKPKKLSEMFRRLNAKMSQSEVTLIIISQIRDKMTLGFGKKYARSGGRALDFYATHIIELAQTKTHTRTVKGAERPFAIQVKAKVDKNKIGPPKREVSFPILFGYGVQDETAIAEWIVQNWDEDSNPPFDTKKDANTFITGARKLSFDESLSPVLVEYAKKQWNAIEQEFVPTRKKYG